MSSAEINKRRERHRHNIIIKFIHLLLLCLLRSDGGGVECREEATTCQQPENDAAAAADAEENDVAVAVAAEHTLNSTEHAYFHWEQREFHRRLRQRLLPQTADDDNLRSLIGSPLLNQLDSRLFVGPEPKTMCTQRRQQQQATMAFSEAAERRRLLKEDQALFEDSIISRVFNDI